MLEARCGGTFTISYLARPAGMKNILLSVLPLSAPYMPTTHLTPAM